MYTCTQCTLYILERKKERERETERDWAKEKIHLNTQSTYTYTLNSALTQMKWNAFFHHFNQSQNQRVTLSFNLVFSYGSDSICSFTDVSIICILFFIRYSVFVVQTHSCNNNFIAIANAILPLCVVGCERILGIIFATHVWRLTIDESWRSCFMCFMFHVSCETDNVIFTRMTWLFNLSTEHWALNSSSFCLSSKTHFWTQHAKQSKDEKDEKNTLSR